MEPRAPGDPAPRRPYPPSAASLLTNYEPPRDDRDRLWLHALLFVVTAFATVWCGGFLVGRTALWDPSAGVLGLLADPTFLADGLAYAAPFLGFLTVHEFGHYLTARALGTRVSLPYYIPVPIPGTLGTFGAVIRIKEPLRRTRQLFDIGAAGPLAGFVVALGVLVYAVVTLPPPEYLLGVTGHEGLVATVRATGEFPVFQPSQVAPGTMAIVFGDTPLFHAVQSLGPLRVPGDEVVHYPLLLAGWLGLFFTALNLLPVGQLDGGHVVYALFGPAVHAVVARVTTLLLLMSGAVGLAADVAWVGAGPFWLGVALLYGLVVARLFAGDWRLIAAGVASMTAATMLVVLWLPALARDVGWTGWLFWVGLILFVVRVDHPPVAVREPLTPGRRALGYLCLVLFALCFSVQPIQVYGG